MYLPHVAELERKVSRVIAEGDGMLVAGGDRHYFAVGASAIDNISLAMSLYQGEPFEVHRVLDYACGYGRVLRWLKVAFPEATILGVDADAKAARSAGEALGVNTKHLDIALSEPLDAEPFDLIWVGSLFTHLSQVETARVIKYLARHLARDGLLVFTTHGQLVARRLALGERLYGLTKVAADALLKELDGTDYGYADYPNSRGYGVAVARPEIMLSMMHEAHLEPLLYAAARWASHQDVFACRRLP